MSVNMANHVYIVFHVHVQKDGEEDIKLIGVYSTRQKAREAVKRKRLYPGFKETPRGFSIDKYQIDKDQWSEGYITVGLGEFRKAKKH